MRFKFIDDYLIEIYQVGLQIHYREVGDTLTNPLLF